MPLLLGLQLHSSLLLKLMSLEGDTKGFIICSSQPPDKSIPPSPPPGAGRQASARRDHWHEELQRARCPAQLPVTTSLLPPSQHCRSCSFMIQSWLMTWWGAHTAIQLKNYWDKTCIFKTSENSLLINPVFQKELCWREVAFSGEYRLKTENRKGFSDQMIILCCGLKQCSFALNNPAMVKFKYLLALRARFILHTCEGEGYRQCFHLRNVVK